jgi:hypothetical protein
MDRDTKLALGGVYLWAGLLVGGYTLVTTGTGGRSYSRIAAKDPTGVLESDTGRGVFQLVRAGLATVAWPVVWLSHLGRESRENA